MPLEAVVQAILDEGRAEAEKILAEARVERERILSDIRAEGAIALAAAEAHAREAAERRRVQELARAELDARKIVLAAQKEALDLVYQRALERLPHMMENEDFLRALLKAAESEWSAEGRVYSSPRDEPFVRRIVGTRYAGSIEAGGGVVIETADGTRRVDSRYETLLRDVWNDSVKEVAEILWPSKAPRS